MSKITTEICIDAICKHIQQVCSFDTINSNSKNWKRISKRKINGTEFIRVFMNKISGLEIYVTATDNEITGISTDLTSLLKSETVLTQTPVSPKTGGLIAFCKSILKTQRDSPEWKDNSDQELEDYISSMLSDGLTFGNLPKVLDPDSGSMEEIDFENFFILSLDDTTIRVSAGGDWQDPLTFSATLVNGKLICNNDAVPTNWDEDEEMSSQDLLNILK